MKYSAKDASSALAAGTYDASIKAVADTKEDGTPLLSKKTGEEMQAVKFEVYTDGAPRTVTQYFTARSTLWLYRKLAKAIGQEESFKAETFNAADHLGSNLRLELEVEESEQYGDQNKIKAFLPANVGGSTKIEFKGTGEGGKMTADDIPF